MNQKIDLVLRLRTMGKSGWNPIGNEAADEILRLRELVKDKYDEGYDVGREIGYDIGYEDGYRIGRTED